LEKLAAASELCETSQQAGKFFIDEDFLLFYPALTDKLEYYSSSRFDRNMSFTQGGDAVSSKFSYAPVRADAYIKRINQPRHYCEYLFFWKTVETDMFV